MSKFVFRNDASKGINLDLDQSRLPPDTVAFLKNVTRNVNTNASAPALSGSSQAVLTPLEGNLALTVSGMPSGANYCIGSYSSEQTNEGYYFLYNGSNNHSIWVISGDTGGIRKVYQGALLNFQLNPQYFISSGRCTIELRSYIDPISLAETNFKFLCFTDNFNEPRLISVEDSIATSSYTSPFGYFTGSGTFYIPDTLITLGVPLPIQCVGLNSPTAYTPQMGDSSLQNMIIRRVWQFRVKFIDVFGRESEHGIISSQYITIVGGVCIATSNGLPRCLDLNFDAGGPLVNYIQIEYRLWVDSTTPTETNWFLYDTIAKYDNSGANQWYQRSINPALTYNSGTNVITYTFCAEKENQPIDTAETSRTEPQVPRWSSSLFSISKRIGLANNVRNFQPIDPAQLAKVSFSAVTPSVSTCGAPPVREVIVYLNIYRPEGLFTTGGLTGIVRTSHGMVVWGNADGPCGSYSSFSQDQVFADQVNPGFIGYMAGMSGASYCTVSQQGDLDPSTGTFTYQGYGSGISFPHIAVQQLKFTNIPAGKYLLRIASHKSKITDINFQRTSTYVAGTCPVSDLLASTVSRDSYATTPYKEIEIDCSAGDVILNNSSDPVFVVLDCGPSISGSAMDGYVMEQAGADTPVEMTPISVYGVTALGTPGGIARGSYFTDHNGFYFGYTTSGTGVGVDIYANFCDVNTVVKVLTYTAAGGGIFHGDGTGTEPGACPGVTGNWSNRVYLKSGGNVYPECGRRRIKQKVALCSDHTFGVPGIPIILTKCLGGVTDSTGEVIIIAHNRYNYLTSIGSSIPFLLASSVPDFSGSPNNEDSLIFSQNGGCQWNTCTACGVSMADVVVNYIGCCTPCSTCRISTESDVYVVVSGINLFGIQSGGKYPVGIVLHDELGRHTYVQKCGYVNAANLNDVGYQQFLLQSIGYTIGSSFQVPTYFKYLTFVVGANTLFTDFFSWAADWVQFIDNTGNTNITNPTAIRIYYSSLIEYNKAYNFSTETGWQFLATDQSGNNQQVPVEGDVVQFIMNGDGTWFTSVISCPVTYDKDGAFFTIDFINDLLTLTNGALFRVIRPTQFQLADNIYYEQCLTIKLNSNGTVPTGSLTGALPYFDSYLLGRLLPVPLLAGQTAAIAPGAIPIPPPQLSSTGITTVGSTTGEYVTNNAANNNFAVIMQTTDSNTSFPFFFESPSPSDFWGNHVSNRGRVFFVNPYEQQSRISTEIALSDALGDRGVLNGLSYFESQNAFVFDRNAWGGITVVLVETSVCMVICNSDHFLTRYNMTQLRVDANGNVIGQNPYGPFSAPERKQGQNFGCIPSNINSIAKYAGTVVWVDAKGHLIFSNFGDALPTEAAGYQGYLLNKISYNNIQNLNPGANGTTYFQGAIDPKTLEYVLTSFNIPASGSSVYINTDTQPNLASNETLIFDLTNGMLKGFASFTPEYYGAIPGYYLQKNFLSFKNGLPYIHHGNFASGVTPPPYAKFYGTQCECRITIVCNRGNIKESGDVGPDDVKRFLYLEFYSREALLTGISGVMPQPVFYADAITTEKLQSSRLKPLRFSQRDGVWVAEFLNDLLTPFDVNLQPMTTTNKLLDGNNLQGRWLQASFVTQSIFSGGYFEISSIIICGNKVFKSGGS